MKSQQFNSTTAIDSRSELTTELTTAKVIILMLQGVVEWYLAALAVKYVGPIGIFEGLWLPIMYVLSIPLLLPAVLFARWSVGFPAKQTLIPVAIVSATALLLDGIGMGMFRPLIYGHDPLIVLAGGSTIFWGVGVALFIALIMSVSANSQR